MSSRSNRKIEEASARVAARETIAETNAVIGATGERKKAARSPPERAPKEEAVVKKKRRQGEQTGRHERDEEREAAQQAARGDEETAPMAPPADIPSRSDPTLALGDAFMHVASLLSEEDVVRAGQVSRRWKQVGTTDAVRRMHGRNIEFAKYEAGIKAPAMLPERGDAQTSNPMVMDIAVALNGTVFVGNFGFTDVGGHLRGNGGIQVYGSDHRYLRTIDNGEFGVASLCLVPGGDEIYASDCNKAIRCWTFDGTLVRTLEGNLSSAACLASGQDGEMYAGSSDGDIFVWGADGGHLGTWQAHQYRVCCLAVDPHRSYLYSGSYRGEINQWDATGRCLQTFEGHTDDVNALVFGPSGRELYSGSGDGSIRVWSPDGFLLRTLCERYMDKFRCLAFSPDGRLYSGSNETYSGSNDSKIEVWTTDGRLLRAIPGHDDGVRTLAFDPNGSRLYSAGRDNTVKVW